MTRLHRQPRGLLVRGLALQPQGASLKATQVVVQRLDVSEDTHGVRLSAHQHHVLHLNEALAVGQVPETQKPHQKPALLISQHHCPRMALRPELGAPRVPSREFTKPPKSLLGGLASHRGSRDPTSKNHPHDSCFSLTRPTLNLQ